MEGTQNEVEGTSLVIDEKPDEKLISEQENTTTSEIQDLKSMTVEVIVTHPLSSNSSNGEDGTHQTTTSIPPSPSASFLMIKSNSGSSPTSRRPSKKSDDSFSFRSRRNTKNDSVDDNRGIYSWGRGGEGQVCIFHDLIFFQ